MPHQFVTTRVGRTIVVVCSVSRCKSGCLLLLLLFVYCLLLLMLLLLCFVLFVFLTKASHGTTMAGGPTVFDYCSLTRYNGGLLLLLLTLFSLLLLLLFLLCFLLFLLLSMVSHGTTMAGGPTVFDYCSLTRYNVGVLLLFSLWLY